MRNTAQHGGARRGAGRKTIEPDLIELERLCSLLCTHAELAKFFGASERTVEKWEKNPTYAEAMDRGRAKGLLSIRHKQMQLLNSGNVAMAIHLGKVYLAQREVTPIELSSSQDKPLKLSLEVLDEIQKLARKNK
jgi:DNA-binding transcriptional regulator YiaG